MPSLGQIERTIKAIQYTLLERIVVEWKLGPVELPVLLNLDELDLPISVKQVIKILQKFQQDGLVHDLVIEANDERDRVACFYCTSNLEKYHQAILSEISNAVKFDNNLRSAFNL